MSHITTKKTLFRSAADTGIKRLLGTTIIAASLMSAHAVAADLTEITRLLRSGKHAQALQMVEEGLKREPLDPQLRFTKGVLLTEQKKTQEAIAIFLKLSEDHPELPEPYNNLAVLYSQDNQFEKARAALNMAIKTNASYATAYENLGDVHARMAAQSYGKALNLNGESTGIQSKLKVLTALGIPKPAPLPAGKPAASVAMATSNAPAPGNVPAVTAPVNAKGAAPAVAAVPNAVTAPSVAAVAQAPALPKQDEAVLSAVDAWVKAWQAKDMDAYLAAYDNDYVGNGAKNHAQWITMRKLRIEGKDTIDITIEKPIVELKGDTAIVSFRQIYIGGKIHSDGMKTLTLEKKSGQWKIIKEVSEV